MFKKYRYLLVLVVKSTEKMFLTKFYKIIFGSQVS